MPVWFFGVLVWGIPALALLAFAVLAVWFRREVKDGFYRRYPKAAQARAQEQS